MTDQNLPPERPLPDSARAERRVELMREITQDSGGRRWLVPAVAAAAVVAVGAVAGAVVAGDEDPVTNPGAPAGRGPAEPTITPDPPTQAPAETPNITSPPSTVPGEVATSMPVGPDDWPEQPPMPCSDLRIPVPGAAEIAAIPFGDTTVRLYGNAERWIVCDEWAALDGGPATLFHPHRFGAPLDREQLGISSNASMDDLDIGEYVAGGALPEGVESITYTFADGHVEEAIVTDDMWAMAYFAGGRRAVEGATVSVTMADGSTDRVELRYPIDFCNQSNHGC